MDILNKFNPPDSTYFNLTSIEPEIHGDELHMVSGEGSRRGWGSPKADYVEVFNSDELTSVVIWNHHKHGGGQAWRHYRHTLFGWKRVMWKGLSEAERMMILDAYQEDRVPGWVNTPGKLERDYIRGKELSRAEVDEQGTIYGYKFLKIGEDRLFHSVAEVSKGATWYNNELAADREPTKENSHGIYCLKNRKNHTLDNYAGSDRRMVRLALSGTIIEGEHGFRAQYAQIVEVLR